MGDFRLITDKSNKAVPNENDLLLIEDSEDSYNNKYLKYGQFTGVIDANTTITVGTTGADFTTLQSAFDYLSTKIVKRGFTVTVQMITDMTAGFTINNFNIGNIIFDMNGYDITVASGTAINISDNSKIDIRNTSASVSNITTNTNGSSNGIYILRASLVTFSALTSNIVIGAIGHSFSVGLYVAENSSIRNTSVNLIVQYNTTYGIYSNTLSSIIFSSGTSSNNGIDAVASAMSYIDITGATYSTTSPVINTDGNNNSQIRG